MKTLRYSIKMAAFSCVLLVLNACGRTPAENRGEWETGLLAQENTDVCELIRDYDFSVQEYPIDAVLYTDAVEEEYKNAFYEAISNQVPMEYAEDGAVYFREWWRGVAAYSDREFSEGLRKAKYRLIDMDGDGLPELAMQWAQDLCVLRYDREEKRVKGYFGPAEGWVLLGSDRFGIHDIGSAGLDRNRYLFLGGQSGIRQEFYFERGMYEETYYTVTADGRGAAVSEEEWKELTADFFDVLANPAEFVPFEEVFSGVTNREMASAAEVEEAQKAYAQFLAGGQSAGEITIADIVEDAAGGVEYLVYDVSGDGLPELHVQTDDKYYIFACQQGRLFVWLLEKKDDYGSERRYDVLENGEVVCSILRADSELYLYWQLQPSAEIMVHFDFSRKDVNGDGIYDAADIYEYDARTMQERYSGVEVQAVTMEEWMAKTADYMEIDEDGGVQLAGVVPWSVYEEEGETDMWRVYEDSSQFEGDIAYADEEMFEILKSAYEEIEFKGDFEKGNAELYDSYKGIFLAFLQNQIPYWDNEKGEQVYIEDITYFFWDIDKDSEPELGVQNYEWGNEKYFFDYDSETEQIVLWYEMSGSWELWTGSGKIACPWQSPMRLWFHQHTQNAEEEYLANCFFHHIDEKETLYMVMLPKYAEDEKEIQVSDWMKQQGVFSQADGQWFFRVTEEQYNEIIAPYVEACEFGKEEMDKVTYTYEELFGGSVK